MGHDSSATAAITLAVSPLYAYTWALSYTAKKVAKKQHFYGYIEFHNHTDRIAKFGHSSGSGVISLDVSAPHTPGLTGHPLSFTTLGLINGI